MTDTNTTVSRIATVVSTETTTPLTIGFHASTFRDSQVMAFVVQQLLEDHRNADYSVSFRALGTDTDAQIDGVDIILAPASTSRAADVAGYYVATGEPIYF